MSIRVLETAAPAVERGRQHGVLMAAAIARNVEVYLARFAAGGMTAGRAIDAARGWLPLLADRHPAYYREMTGIADGAAIDLEAVALLNLRYELSYGVFGQESGLPGDEPDGCTAFGLLPERTRSGHVVMGQNWDWLAAIHGSSFVMRARRDDGPDFVAVMEAGIVGTKMGINEHGIGLCINGMVSRHDGFRAGARPFHVRCRDIIDSRRFDLALQAAVAGVRMGSANFMIGTAEGEIVDIETAPEAHACLYPDGGLLAHANHFTALPEAGSRMEMVSAGTLFRGERLRRLLARGDAALDAGDLRLALSDHLSHPFGICRHADPDLPVEKRTMTAIAVILDLTERVLWVADGPPCETPFDRFDLRA